jgi:ABC-type uncharacterized transport system ATPase subunit
LKNISFVLNMTEINQEVARIGEQYGLPVDPTALIWQLSVGEQQRVEIIKMLYRGAQILILDEPTAVLTPQETEGFFETLKGMTAEGRPSSSSATNWTKCAVDCRSGHRATQW